MAKLSLDRQIQSLTDDELESFVRDWAARKAEYIEVERFSGAGDRGRDVVGYRTKNRHEGQWDNYQCKQYKGTVSTAIGMAELGKILYYSFLGEFTRPEKYFFVAPRGVNRNLRTFISNPSKFKQELLDKWDEYCAKKIIDNKTIDLTSELRKFIEEWDFSSVKSIAVDDILADPASKPVLKEWFDVDPGPAPIGVAPDDIAEHELPYVQELLDAYGEREGCVIDKDGAIAHAEHGPHLRMQRERFFDADSFSRFYRDNTMQADIDILRRDLLFGIAEVHGAKYADTLRRVDAVMMQAGVVQPSGTLARHARVPVRQGLCHHFVNEGTLKWRKS
ncbi:hypothetical protein JL100_002590 [Skermanella mucosa]|uniref:ABC-three component system protein n=1 Tax=Skermanella mucosa TaxID=1789672 RepID=UPI00192B7704|nr:ABC-three component system protein [Skermanella mucosa]UEM21678.1 hypothetical protein JL100_002590 [Skermanella mucosa]